MRARNFSAYLFLGLLAIAFARAEAAADCFTATREPVECAVAAGAAGTTTGAISPTPVASVGFLAPENPAPALPVAGAGDAPPAGPAEPELTPEQLARILAERQRVAVNAAVATIPEFRRENEGYQVGFKYSLANKVPVDDGQGNFAYTQAQIDAAKEDAERLEPIYEEKLADLIRKIKADIGYDQKSKRFQENFDFALKKSYFDPVITPSPTGKPEDARLNVQIADGLLRRALTEATFATVDDPAELAEAREELEKAKTRLAKAKIALKKKQDERDETACRDLREQRDREFSLDGTGSGSREPAGDEIRNNVFRIN